VNRNYEALAASWREDADGYVRKARNSNNLRDMVRLIALASTLEQAARRLSSSANLHEVARVVSEATKLHNDGHRQPLQATESRAEKFGRTSRSDERNLSVRNGPLIVLRKSDVERLNCGIAATRPKTGDEP
jgi:hypothetical protein